MHELEKAIQETRELLKESRASFRSRGVKRAKAIRDFNIARAKKMLELKSQGCPATTQKHLALGDEYVADKELEMHIAISEYDSLQESINILKKDFDFLVKQKEMDWRG